MNGWFKVHREMWDHAVWCLPPGQRCVWLTCLKLANTKPGQWWDGREQVDIPVGSFITSQDHLLKAARVSRQIVRDALRNLERIGSIRTKIATKRWTLVEVVNWPSYQGREDTENQEENLRGTKREPSENHNVRRREGKKNTPANGLPHGFAVWWEEYPKKVGKIQAAKEWADLNPDEALQAVMLEALRKQKRTVKAMVENDQHHVLDPERWIKYRRWDDEVSGAMGGVPQYPVL